MLVPSCEMKRAGMSHNDDWVHRLPTNDVQMRLGFACILTHVVEHR